MLNATLEYLHEQEIFKGLQFWWDFVPLQTKHHSLNEGEGVFHGFRVVQM